MKKILTVLLVLTLSAAGLFAADPFAGFDSTITLNATVDNQNPDFDITASLVGDFTDSAKALKVADPAENSIDVYVKLWQTNIARYSGTLKLEVTGNEFELKADSSVKSTVKPSVEVVPGTLANGSVLKAEKVASTEGNVYKAKLNYQSVSPVNANTQVLQLHFHWGKDVDLKADDYKSTIKVSITGV